MEENDHKSSQNAICKSTSTAECNKVVSDIFGKFKFLMKYHQNIFSYAHFAPFLKIIILLVSEILRKKCKKRRKYKNVYQ